MLLRLLPEKTSFDFMGKRWIGFIASLALTLLSLGALTTQGLNLGIDFTGGILMEVRTETPADLGALRNTLSTPQFGEVSLQHFGSENDLLIRIQTSETQEQAAIVAQVKELLTQTLSGVDFRKIDYVGPTVGKELVRDGTLAVVLAFAAILVYVWFRFEWQYGVGAILAMMHDAVMLVGFFAITRFEFGLTALAAILTVVGYSINDSVVIYDRIRENMRKYKRKEINDLLNLSINETLSRTILTASTTALAGLSLALFGGEVIKGFAWAIVFGVGVGTYSSIYVSAPVLIYFKLHRQTTAEESENGALGTSA